MAVSIPTPSKDNTTLRISLGSSLFDIHYSWNNRAACWYITLSLGGIYIFQGAKVMMGDILEPNADTTLLQGYIICSSNNNRATVVTRDNLGIGKDFTLTYHEEV